MATLISQTRCTPEAGTLQTADLIVPDGASTKPHVKYAIWRGKDCGRGNDGGSDSWTLKNADTAGFTVKQIDDYESR